MPKISVITPTIRKEGLEIIRNSLKKQNLQDFEWLIGSPFDPEIPEARWIKDDFEGGFWTLNRIYNKLFREAKGDIIVSWQDWIYSPPLSLTKFLIASRDNEKGLISGVGDQYSRVGEWGRPEVKIWQDPRKTDRFGSFYECNWNDAEFNFCAMPRDAIFDAGGMDEQLDFLGFGGDQLQLCERLNDLGYKFFLDQDNESFTLRHGRDNFGGEESWNDYHVLFNGAYEGRKKQLKEKGEWPRLTYLVK